MRYARFLIFPLLAAILVAGLPACSSADRPLLTPSALDEVKIVSSLPTRGLTAQRSREISAAITLAVREHGALAGGNKVVYVPLEDGNDETGDWSPQLELANAQAASDDSSVVAYIGPYASAAAAVSLPVTNRAGLLEASPSATWPGLTLPGWNPGEPNTYFPSGKRSFVRLMPPDSAQADAAALWAHDLGFRAATVLEDGSSYSNGLADEFEHVAGANGISVTAELEIDPASMGTDMRFRSMKTGAAFYAPSSAADGTLVAKAIAGTQAAIFSADTALEPQFISGAGPEAVTNWHIVSNSRQPEKPGAFASGLEPDHMFPSQFAANAFDLTTLVLKALDSGAGRNRAAIVKSVLEAATPDKGERLFDDAGDPVSRTLSGYVWSGSAFTFNRTLKLGP